VAAVRIGYEKRDEEFVRPYETLQRGCRTADVNPRMGGMLRVQRREEENGGGERIRECEETRGVEMAKSTTKKDGERESDGEERHSSLVALSTRAPPSSASAPKTPTLAASPLFPEE